jgi:hypothetical protein
MGIIHGRPRVTYSQLPVHFLPDGSRTSYLPYPRARVKEGAGGYVLY